MKKNVYERVQAFYDEAIVWEPIIQQEWVEGFLRQKAWQGISDDKLKDIWQQIQLLILYLTHFDNEDLDEISLAEYSFIVTWLKENVSGFKATLKSVRHFFNILIEFYTYLHAKKIILNLDEIKEAAREISGGNEINILKSESILEGLKNIKETGGFDDALPVGIVIGEAVESLMLKLGKYFQQQEFAEDFERALYLYTGPFDNVTEEAEEEFWLGFWDYFLFDYHLLENDLKPLEYFNATYGERLSKDEFQILQSLLGSSFTVFYIKRIINQDLVECVNLFTNEIFQLPMPEFDYKTLKKLLFFGHIFSQGLVMINYVTSLEVSVNLRKRIKEEVMRQRQIFIIQEPGADLEAFFKRHALVVRHTINILVTLAKVNVTSLSQLERSYPVIEAKRAAQESVKNLLHNLVAEFGLSRFDEQLLEKMWYDFCQLSAMNVRKPMNWAMGLLLAYSHINGTVNMNADQIAEKMNISIASLYKIKVQLYEVLHLEPFDPRYLSEDGFVNFLFAE